MPALLFLLCLLPAPSRGAESLAGEEFFKDDPSQPWHITADEISQDRISGAYLAHGNVVVTKQGRRLNADRVRLDQKNDMLYAEGHVMLTAGDDLLTGEKLKLNLADETGTVTDGTVFLSQNHFYIRGKTIHKTGKDTYEVHDASVTTCDGPSADWRLTGRKLNITIEGYGYATHAALWARKLPVMYTPALFFPVKIRRQTGFLPPMMGRSDRHWEEVEVPFFWAIDDSSDATLTVHHMARRGTKYAAEYRYVLDEESRGTVMIDALDDRKRDDGTTSSDEWGYTGDTLLRPNSDRYWLRMKHDQTLDGDITVKLDLDVVSDQDYLDEFKGGYTGFRNTDRYFTESFGRDLDEYDDNVRLNTLTANKSWASYSLNASSIWYDDVVARRQGVTDTTLQQLPKIEFDATRQQVLDWPVYATLDSEFTGFYRETGIRGQRIDAHPRVYFPMRFRNYFTLEPSLGLRETAWHVESFDTAAARNKQRTTSRETYDLKIDLSSEIYRIFSGFGKTVRAIRHVARPQVVYDYAPHPVQDKHPYFDATDRLAEENLITYSLTNTLTAKSLKPTRPDPAESGGKPPAKAKAVPQTYGYTEFLRFKLEQSYDINKDRAGNPQPFSTVYGELDVLPGRFFSVGADAEWSQYTDELVSHNLMLHLWDSRGDKASFEHRYSQGASESLYGSATVKIIKWLSGYLEHERNLYTGKDILTRAGLIYEDQCWSLDVRYSHEGEDRSYVFLIRLYGIGEIGSNIAGHRLEDPLKFKESNP